MKFLIVLFTASAILSVSVLSETVLKPPYLCVDYKCPSGYECDLVCGCYKSGFMNSVEKEVKRLCNGTIDCDEGQKYFYSTTKGATLGPCADGKCSEGSECGPFHFFCVEQKNN